MKLKLSILFLISLLSIYGCVICVNFASAWQEPTEAPPAGNVPAPINVSADAQTKSGYLGLYGQSADPEYGLKIGGPNGGSTSAAVYGINEDGPYGKLGLRGIGGYFYSNISRGSGIFVKAETGSQASGILVSNSSSAGIGVKANATGSNSSAGYFKTTGASGTAIYSSGTDYGLYSTSANYPVYALNSNGDSLAYLGKTDYGIETRNSDSGTAAFYGQWGTTENWSKVGLDGYGLWAKGEDAAGYFEGDVIASGNLQVGGTATINNINVIGNCYGSCSGDLAESLMTRKDVDFAEIVAINEDGFLEKALFKNQQQIIGITSTNPSVVFPGKDLKDVSGKKMPIALAGVVALKVNNENGQIKVGDFITASKYKAGYGVKAIDSGTVVGKALESLDEREGSIEVFVSLSYYNR